MLTCRHVAMFLTVTLCCLAGCRDGRSQSTVTIRGHRWNVTLAITPAEQAQGLGDRNSLGENEGMAFIFPRPEPRTFHMLRCRIPLDVAFIDSDKTVVKVDTMQVELDPLNPRYVYVCPTPAQYVLEVNAGQLADAGVAVGDKVSFSANITLITKDQR